MPFNLESLTSPGSLIRTGLPQVISAMVKNLLLISTTNLSPYLILEGVADSNSNQTHHFNTTSVAWFGYVNMAIVPIGGIVSGFVTNAIGTKFSLQGALAIIIFLRMISLFFKEVWSFYLVVVLTNFCSEFFKGPVFTHLAESAEPHLRTTLSASASSSMIFGQFQQLLMSTFLSPQTTTYINCALPCACIFLLIIVPETPHALIMQNKLEKARKSLAWYRGWVKVEVVEAEYQQLLAYHREEELKKKLEEQENNEENEPDIVEIPSTDKERPATSDDHNNDTSSNSVTAESSRLTILKGAIKGSSGRLKKFTATESSPLSVFKNAGTSAANRLGSLKSVITKEHSVDIPDSVEEQPTTSTDLKNDTADKTASSHESPRLDKLKGTVEGKSGRLDALKKLTTTESGPLSMFKNVTTSATNRLGSLKSTITNKHSVVDIPNSVEEQPTTSSDLKNDTPGETASSHESSRLGKLKGVIKGECGHLDAFKKLTTTESGPLKVFKNVTSGATSHLGSLKNSVTSESSVLHTMKDKVPIHLLEEGFNTVKNVKIFARQSFVLPLALVTFTHFLVFFTGTTVLLSQPEKILNTLQSPLDARYAAVVLSGANVIGSFISVMVIKLCGKRLIVFISLIGMTVCSVAISLYGYLTDIHYDGNNHNVTASILLSTTPSWNTYNWIPLVILFLLCIISNFGLCNLPWVLVGELFSKSTRAVGTGITSGITSFLDSFCNASLGTLLTILGFSGLYGFYAGVSVAGVIILHFILPDTEGKSLDEIEKYFDELPFFINRISEYINVVISKFRRINVKCLDNSSNNNEKEELNSEKNKSNNTNNYCSI